MSDNRILKSLHRTDESTAHAIMQQYPAQWDMDKIFQKTYQKYLAQTKEKTQEEVFLENECEEALKCRKEISMAHRFRRVGSFACCAAAYIGIFLFVLQMDDTAPHTDHSPNATNNSDFNILEVDRTEKATTAASDEQHKTETQMTSTIQTDPPETTITSEAVTTPLESSTEQSEQDAPNAIETTETTMLPEPLPPESTEMELTEPTEPVTVPPPMESEPSDTTSFTETIPTETETTTTTEAPPMEQAFGYFEVNEPANPGEFYQITYVRENTEPVEEHEHSFAAEGFTVTEMRELNPDFDFRSMYYTIEDENGQHYAVEQMRYAYFGRGFNSTLNYQTKAYEIGGKPVLLLYREGEGSVCTLMWDDGCHVCAMTSQLKDLDKMELLVQSQITY